MPAMAFTGNLVYVGIAVMGGLQVASGAMQLRDVQAFIQCSGQSHGRWRSWVHCQRAAVRRGPGRAGV